MSSIYCRKYGGLKVSSMKYYLYHAGKATSGQMEKSFFRKGHTSFKHNFVAKWCFHRPNLLSDLFFFYILNTRPIKDLAFFLFGNNIFHFFSVSVTPTTKLSKNAEFFSNLLCFVLCTRNLSWIEQFCYVTNNNPIVYVLISLKKSFNGTSTTKYFSYL